MMLAGSANVMADSKDAANMGVYVYKSGQVLEKFQKDVVDSVAYEEEKTVVTLYNKSKEILYSAPVASVDSIVFKPMEIPQVVVPKADLLDIVFNADGTATDVSPMANKVEMVGDPVVYASKTYNCNVATFGNVWGAATSQYYKVDYSSNQAFRDKLADGHTLEALVMANVPDPVPNSEVKFFASHAAGGTGLMVCKTGNSMNNANELMFLPNVTETGKSVWRFVPSGVAPQSKVFYHVVGVWDKAAGKAYVYINGELKNTVDAKGDFKFPASGADWFAIGCDSDPKGGAQGWNGDVVLARAYDAPLNSDEVALLWKQVEDMQQGGQDDTPKADLLDVVFKADGSAEDVSPMHNAVQTIGTPTVYANTTYKCNVARFENPWGGAAAQAYKVDYSANKDMMDKLADGHTLEALVMGDMANPFPNAEAKFFASHEAGGTGLMVCKTANGRGNELTFLPNVSDNGKSSWKWATSGIVPAAKTFYHVVGVWNKDEGKAYVYVNGELKNTVDAAGNLNFAKDGSKWFGIGCDSNPGNGGNAWNGEVVFARAYDATLTAEQVGKLWKKVEEMQGTGGGGEDIKTPVADMLDIEFNNDGSAVDVSPMKNKVQVYGAPTISYNDAYQRNMASFDNVWGGSTSQYYKVDYSDNQTFKDKLADGHTLEAVVMAKDIPTDAAAKNKEVKFLSSQEAGGTGLMVCKTDKGLNKANELTFLTNVSETGKSSWKWGVSGVEPLQNKYYHIVGVWNKEEGKAYVYVNGELKNTADAKGNFVFPKANANWFAIGCDAGPTGQAGWNGNVVLARVYDAPLKADEVEALWKKIESNQGQALVTNVSFYSGVAVKSGMKYEINGKGFAAGDKVKLTSMSNEAISATLPAELNGDKGVTITIPQGVPSDTYSVVLVRGDKTQTLGSARIVVVEEMPAGAEVIAHRGWWEGNAQNSRASLQKAVDANLYGSETDIWITTDGKLMVNHDEKFDGVTIKASTSDECKKLKLANGENMPELNDLLDIVKKSSTRTKLIIEIKDHGDAALNKKAASVAVKAVKAAGVEDKVEYISFNADACEQVIADDSKAKVAYLKGGVSPADLKAKGYTGLDYSMAEYRNHPEWVAEAKKLGMTVNAWTVNAIGDMFEMTNLGVQFITTDKPAKAEEAKAYYDNHK